MFSNIDQIIEIVRQAAQFMVTDGFEIEQKDGVANIVTSSDVAVQEFLREQLSALIPDSGFLCEEEDAHDLSHAYTWIIDPIDGTANYSRGIRECAISVGLKHGEQMETAVVFLPRANELFSAERGKGAFLNGQRIHVSSRSFANSLLCTALCVYHKENARLCSDIIMDAYMQCNDVRRFGAAAPELCYLAAGRCELFFEFMLAPWDYAASMLVLEEAGGCLSNLQGKMLDPTCGSGVLAANSLENLQKLQEIVASRL